MKPKTKLGEFLLSLRKDLYISSQKDFAETIGISSSFLTQIESGEKKMPGRVILKVIELYKLDEDKQKELKLLTRKRTHPIFKLLLNFNEEELNKIYNSIKVKYGK